MSEETIKYVGVVVTNTKGGIFTTVARGVVLDDPVVFTVENDTGIRTYPWVNVLEAKLVKFDSEYTEEDFTNDYEEYFV
jgi:hypothetical protein